MLKKYNREFRNPNDLEPEEERLIGEYVMETYGSPLVFVTHYPSKSVLSMLWTTLKIQNIR